MYYEVYIDSLFFLNFCMDYFLLLLVSKIVKRSATRVAILPGAVFGAAGTCILTVYAAFSHTVIVAVAHVIVSVCMVVISFRMKRFSAICNATIVLYILAFLFGGVMDFLLVHVPFLKQNGLTAAVIIGTGYILYLATGAFLKKRRARKEAAIYPVKMFLGNDYIELKALFDTGNGLVEPISGKPVSIVERRLVEKYMENGLPEGYRVIPYHSIGKNHGIMHGFEVPQIWIQTEEQNIEKEKIMIGVFEGQLAKNSSYQMILHPQLLEG